MEEAKSKYNYEALLWSIALPGFGQFINKKVVKGIVLIFFEVLINVMSNFNLAIVESFNGNIYRAIDITNYQWLMFYPCFYMFSLWDAFRDSNTSLQPYLYLPFAFGAYFITVGLIYSARIKIFGVLLGPVFLPMLFLIPGLLVGFTIRKIVMR
jgi:TM2 domain-containing membrane protein YozV